MKQKSLSVGASPLSPSYTSTQAENPVRAVAVSDDVPANMEPTDEMLGLSVSSFPRSKGVVSIPKPKENGEEDFGDLDDAEFEGVRALLP